MTDQAPTQPAGAAQGLSPQDAATIMGIMGTLSAGGLLGPSQAELAKQQADIHQQVQAAQDQSEQANQAWQQAVQTPFQPSPGTGFFQGLLGNTASVLTRNPQYARQAADQMDQAHTELLQSRIQNLAALKDTYDRRAAIADKLSNTEVAMKMRQSSESVAKGIQTALELLRERHQTNLLNTKEEHQDVRAAKHEAAATARTAQTNATRLQTSGRTTAAADVNLDDYVDSTTTGHKYIDLSTIPDKKDQRAISEAARKQGLPIMKDGSPIKTIEAARAQLNDLQHYAGQLEANNALTRPFVALKNAIGASTELDPNAASFITTRQNVIGLIQSLAAAGKGNRVMQQEIKIALNTLPTMGNTKDVGGQKIAKARKSLDNIERALIGGRGPLVPQLSTGGNAKTQVLAAIRKGDIDQVNAILDRNPALEKDQNINDLVDEMLNAEPAK